MNINQNILIEALQLLGGILDRDKLAKPIHFVVCGGSSLLMKGLVARTTRDVDIIAYISTKDKPGALQYASVIPDFLANAALRVAADLGLDANWLNTGPRNLLQYGLPEGFIDRLHTKHYGNKLTVSFIDRLDQIHFKVYAAVDTGPGRHVNDLLALQPTGEEIELAAKWTLLQDPSPEFAQLLISMLKALHYESVIDRLEK